MKRKLLGLILLSLAGVVVCWLFFNPKTDKELIIDQLNAMADACSKRSGETAVTTAMKNAELSNLIAPTCSVSISEVMVDGTFQPLEFAGQVTRARTLFSRLSGSIDDVEVSIAPDKKSATVEYSVKVKGARAKDGESFEESRDLKSKMVKIDGKWKIASFEIRQVLEK